MFLALVFLFPFFPDDLICILAGLTDIPLSRFFVICLFTRPWGLLVACGVGSSTLVIPLWGMILLGLAGSKMLEAGRQVGLRVASEVFADRAYQADGSLVPRSKPGAVIHDKDEAISRTIRMVTEGKVTAITGEEVSIEAHSICVHGDNPSAVEFVKNIRAKLEGDGVAIAPIAQIV